MLKPSEKRPTVKRLPRFVRHSPTTSSPPVEQLQVSARPRAKPHRMPPTRHEARRSSKIGTAGDWITLKKNDDAPTQISVRIRNARPRTRHARYSTGMLMRKYKIPAMSTPAGSSTACASSVRMTWLSPTTPPE